MTEEYVQTQRHLLECEAIIQNCYELYNDTEVRYEDIFSEHLEKQLQAVKLFTAVLETKEMLDDDMSLNC